MEQIPETEHAIFRIYTHRLIYDITHMSEIGEDEKEIYEQVKTCGITSCYNINVFHQQ